MHDIMKKLDKFATMRNWHQFHKPKDLAISISIEAAELLEIFQWKSDTENVNHDEHLAIESEVADIFQYLFLLCNRLNIDPYFVIEQKMKINEKRFPVDKTYGIAKPKGD